MDSIQLNWITGYIWGIADDVLRDLYVRGKYCDVIVPMAVLRRLDAVLEPTKQAELDMKANLDMAGVTNQDAALRQASRQALYNTSKFTLRDLRARAIQQQLKADFEDYLDGFSSNVQDILENFEFRNQIPRLSMADALMSYSRLPATWPALSALFKAAYHMEPISFHIIGWRAHEAGLPPYERHSDIAGGSSQ